MIVKNLKNIIFGLTIFTFGFTFGMYFKNSERIIDRVVDRVIYVDVDNSSSECTCPSCVAYNANA